MATIRSNQLFDMKRDSDPFGRMLVPTYESLDIQDLVPGEVFGIVTSYSHTIEVIVLAITTPGPDGREMEYLYLNFIYKEVEYNEEGDIESENYWHSGSDTTLFGGVFTQGQPIRRALRNLGEIETIFQISSAYISDNGHSWPHE